jgi:hypothetical protein
VSTRATSIRMYAIPRSIDVPAGNQSQENIIKERFMCCTRGKQLHAFFTVTCGMLCTCILVHIQVSLIKIKIEIQLRRVPYPYSSFEMAA